LAAGCPVVVKAHPAHPGTSALVGEAIKKAAEKHMACLMVFSLLYDDAYAVGEALVKHPKTKIVTFTGSLKGGMALVKWPASVMNLSRYLPKWAAPTPLYYYQRH
jgi:alpha-ketoglutaric semialdehyde dehydrogenase